MPGFAFAFEDAIDGAFAMIEDIGIAMNEALWPPTQTKLCGSACLVLFARSITSGMFAR